MSSSSRFLDCIRQFNRRALNPWILQSAGEGGSPFAVVGHTGRRSGAPYRTPVIVMPAEDGFVFALTYGPGVDWYRNILAAGSCTLLWRGQMYTLTQPAALPGEAARRVFPIPLCWILRLLRKHDFFQMQVHQGPALDSQAAS